MPGPATVMRELHRLRKHAKELQTRIEQMPRQINVQQGSLGKQDESVREFQEGIKKLKVKTHEKEVSLKTTVNLITKHEKQLEEVTAKKEYDALKTEIAAEKAKASKLEDEILTAMAEIEERTAKLPELEKTLQQAKKQVTEFERTVKERQQVLSAELAQTQQKLAEVEATLPMDDVRKKYEREVRGRGEDALSAVEGRTCLACYTEITAQHYNELQQDSFVLCITCGRILYRAE